MWREEWKIRPEKEEAFAALALSFSPRLWNWGEESRREKRKGQRRRRQRRRRSRPATRDTESSKRARVRVSRLSRGERDRENKPRQRGSLSAGLLSSASYPRPRESEREWERCGESRESTPQRGRVRVPEPASHTPQSSSTRRRRQGLSSFRRRRRWVLESELYFPTPTSLSFLRREPPFFHDLSVGSLWIFPILLFINVLFLYIIICFWDCITIYMW